MIAGERKYHDYSKGNSEIKKNLNLDVKTRLIRNQLRESETVSTSVKNEIMQSKINQRKKSTLHPSK